MHLRKETFELSVYESLEELPAKERELLQTAIKAREGAYAPYSNFKVGAAILLENEEIVIGNNQENASFPSGLCAERVAVFQAGARFPGKAVIMLAVSAASLTRELNKPAAPCGNCRQSLSEYEQRQKSGIKLVMMGESGQVFVSSSVANLLPLSFGSSYLK